jgi:hypothetical protein
MVSKTMCLPRAGCSEFNAAGNTSWPQTCSFKRSFLANSVEMLSISYGKMSKNISVWSPYRCSGIICSPRSRARFSGFRMPSSSSLSPQDFDRFLYWLEPNRETSAQKYQEIHQKLTRYFYFKGCKCPEDLTDETVDRVAIRVLRESLPAFSNGHLKLFYGFAKNVYLEYLKYVGRFESFEPGSVEAPGGTEGAGWLLAILEDTNSGDASAEQQHRCLDRCLKRIAAADRELLLHYYNYARGEKALHRKAIAREWHITLNALRIRICRLQSKVGYCVKQCLGSEGLAQVQ